MEFGVDQELIDAVAAVWQRAADDWGSVCHEYNTEAYNTKEQAYLDRVQEWLRDNGVEFVSKKDGSPL